MRKNRRTKNAPNRQRLTEQTLRHLETRKDTYLVWDTAQPGLAVQVTPSGTVSFKTVYRFQGRLRWYHLDRYPAILLADARDAARKVRAKAALGDDPQGEKMAGRIGDTLNHIASEYVERYARDNNKSWKQGDSLLKTYVLPKLGTRKARDLTRLDVRRIFDALTEAGRAPLANQVLAAISAVLSWATERELLAVNVARGIKRNKTGSSLRFLSDEEIRAVWPKFDDLGLLPSTALRLVLLLGQRPGEVRHMRREDIDLGTGLWTLPGEPVGIWPGTKNGRTHEIPLSRPALDLLEEIGLDGTGPVFPSLRAGRPIPIPQTRGIWEALDIPRFRPHDLRATAATGMDKLGIAKDSISRVLNHVEGGMTEKYIRHDHLEQKRFALDTWAAEVMAIIEGRKRDGKVVPIKAKGT